MINEAFRIYTDRLKDNEEQVIQEELDPSFLDIVDQELKFEKNVSLQGTAYLADDELVLRLNVSTVVTIPCVICTDWIEVPIVIEDFIHVVPLTEIRTGVYDFREILRDEILLAVPNFVECHNGKCPSRKDIDKFLKKPDAKDQEDVYHPFADL